jgi:hypothetical protein
MPTDRTPMRSLILIAALVAALLAPVRTAAQQDLSAVMPQGAYGAALAAALLSGDFDFAALRALYAADPAFTGRSRLADWEIEAMLADQAGTPPPEWSEEEVLRAIFADFPLLETQVSAFRLFTGSSDPNAAQRAEFHAVFYRGLLDSILATRQDGPQGPVYKVLSIAEENIVLDELGMDAGTQSLVDIGGKPHDRRDTTAGPVFFDISAFFGR